MVMIADPLTKSMKADVLQKALNENFWSWEQPTEAKRVKTMKQAQRKNAKERKKEDAGDDTEPNVHVPWHAVREMGKLPVAHVTQVTSDSSTTRSQSPRVPYKVALPPIPEGRCINTAKL